jgi:UDP-N-acetylmuramate--alanine ligase
LLEGRRLWFVGIGGAGMSALALVAREWGAEVGGSDRARSSYVDRLEAAGIPVAIGHDAANVPDGAELIVSSAIAPDNPEVAGREVRKRGELLAELVELRPSIVVAGAHGKTTTSAMIAFCLDRLELDPAYLIGGELMPGTVQAVSGDHVEWRSDAPDGMHPITATGTQQDFVRLGLPSIGRLAP